MRLAQILFIILVCFVSLKADDDKNTIEIDGKQYTIHQVQGKETLFSIAQYYHIELQALITTNRLEIDKPISKNELLIIPLDNQKEEEHALVRANKSDGEQIHLVQPGETLYSISKKYNLATNVIMAKNNMKSPELKYGQELLIPLNKENIRTDGMNLSEDSNSEKTSPTPLFDTDTLSTDTLSYNQLVEDHVMNLKNKFEQTDTNNVLQWKRGIATWVDDGTSKSTNFFALYNGAPVGSVLQIKNLLNHKTVYVKVVGKMPNNTEEEDKSIIKLSAAVTDYLGIYDERFLVEIYAHQIAAH